MAEHIGSFLAILCTLAILSFLYRDNPIYKFAEHLFVGLSAAYGAVIVYFNVFRPNFADRFFSLTYLKYHPWDWALLFIPLVLGLMMFGRFTRRFRWMLAYPLALVVGAFAGVNIPGYASADLVKQVQATMIPLNVKRAEIRSGEVLNVYGYNFGKQDKRSGVLFGRTEGEVVFWSPTRVSVKIPDRLSPKGDIRLLNHFGTARATAYRLLSKPKDGKKGPATGKLHTLPASRISTLSKPKKEPPLTAGPRVLAVAPIPVFQIMENLSALLNVVGLCCALLYFFFSRAHTGALGVASRVGIWFLMISFGASFGYTVMGRVSLAVGRAQELLLNPWMTLAAAALVFGLLLIWRLRSADKTEPKEEETRAES